MTASEVRQLLSQIIDDAANRTDDLGANDDKFFLMNQNLLLNIVRNEWLKTSEASQDLTAIFNEKALGDNTAAQRAQVLAETQAILQININWKEMQQKQLRNNLAQITAQ